MLSPSEREAKEGSLFDLLYAEAVGQYGAAGSEELDQFMEGVEAQIAAMSDAELQAELDRRA